MNAYLTAIAAAAVFALGAGSGYKLTADHFTAKEAKEQEAAAEAYQAKAEELNAVSAQLEQAKNERKVVYRTITKQVEKVVTRDVYRNVCLDDSGVQLVNAALAGKPIDSSQLNAAVPAAGAAAGNDGR
jgi:hypothetical protein